VPDIRLQFVLGSGLRSRAIAWWGNGYGGLSHCDGILSDGRLLGARSDAVGGQPAGTDIRPANYEKWLKRIVVTFDASPLEYASWEASLRAKIGTPYDTAAIWGFITGRSENTAGQWICSALQINALQHIGRISFPLPMPAHQITPNTLLNIAVAVGGTFEVFDHEAPVRRDPAESVADARELRHNFKTLTVPEAASCNEAHSLGEDVPLPVCGNEGRDTRSGRNQASAVVRQGEDRVERHHEHV